MKQNQTIKVGDKIKHTTFSGKVFEGVVTSIEKSYTGCKYGMPVESAVIGSDGAAAGVIGSDIFTMCLDNGKWCYGSQVVEVLN